MEKDNLQKGLRGVFDKIEDSANTVCANGLFLLAAAATVLLVVISVTDHSAYMRQVRICTVIMDVICVAAGLYSVKKKNRGILHKYFLFLVWSVALGLIVTSIDSTVTLLYAIPILLAMRYYSVVFTVAVSVLNIIFAFIPYIINAYLQNYPLDCLVLNPGTVITMAGDSLDGTINAMSGAIDLTKTITNMLTLGYLMTAAILVIISVIAVSFTKYSRDSIVKQYNNARTRMEG